MFKLYMILAYIFLKQYISKICNGFSDYIYDLELIGFRLFNFGTQ